MAKKKYILVTGGAGYIGSHTVVALIKDGYTPIILDDFRNAKPTVIKNLESLTNSKLIVVNKSCQDKVALAQLAKQYAFWGVIHFAADKAVGESVENPLKYYQNNLISLLAILAWMQENEISNFVFSSSCTVYGNPADKIVTEQTATQKPESPYGNTKLMAENILQDLTKANNNFNVILLRYFNPIGAHPSSLIGEEPQGIPNNLLPYVTQTANGIREKLTVFGKNYPTADGTCVRDYIHVVDLAMAHVKALRFLEKSKNKNLEIFNIGTGKGTSVLELISIFEKVVGSKLNWEFGEPRPGDVPEIFAAVNKANKVLNWQAIYTVEDAVKDAWNWELNKDK